MNRALLYYEALMSVLYSPLMASLQPPPLESFILLLLGILEYRARQTAGAILADKKPAHFYLVAEISTPMYELELEKTSW
jgi:hypothetical protein